MTNAGALPNIEALVTCGGDITIGAVAPHIECAATACDEAQCLAMIVRGNDETLDDLLRRLDRGHRGDPKQRPDDRRDQSPALSVTSDQRAFAVTLTEPDFLCKALGRGR